MKTPREIANFLFAMVDDWYESRGENTEAMCIEKIEQAIQAERDKTIRQEKDRIIAMTSFLESAEREIILREECGKLREENTQLSKNLQHWMEESFKWNKQSQAERVLIEKLFLENSRMREALKEAENGLGWLLARAGAYIHLRTDDSRAAYRRIQEVLSSIPETDKYVKIREAELAVVAAVKLVIEVNAPKTGEPIWTTGHDVPDRPEMKKIKLELEKLDQLQKESEEK